jgi:hypothetical protein
VRAWAASVPTQTIHIHIQTHTHIHTHIHTYIHTYIHTCAHMPSHAQAHTLTHSLSLSVYVLSNKQKSQFVSFPFSLEKLWKCYNLSNTSPPMRVFCLGNVQSKPRRVEEYFLSVCVWQWETRKPGYHFIYY